MRASSSRHLVDPELLPLLDSLPDIELSEAILPLVRAAPARFAVDPRDVERTAMRQVKVPGPQGAPDVPVLVYRPKNAVGELPCILHIHGGGYVSGSAASMEAVHRALAADLNCCIVSVDYRLAPETRYPGAVEDCYAVLRWISANARDLGIDLRRLGVMGESAGGGLAAALTLLVRDRGEFSLAFQHLVYPMLDDRTCVAPEPHPFTGEFVWTRQRNHFGWRCLLGVEPGSEGVSPYAAPARATDLRNLPPLFLSTAALDLFLEENLEYARRLVRSAVPVELHVYPGAFHGFQWAPTAGVSMMAARDTRDALRRAMA